jgi:hypothetical protein
MPERVTFAVFALLAGAFSLWMLLMPPAPLLAPNEFLAYVQSHKAGFAMAAVVILVWVAVSIPYVAGLGILLGTERRILATAAMLLSAGGILLLGFASFVSLGSFLAMAAAADAAPATGEAAYQVAVWRNLGFYMSDPGLMTWGLGQFLFAALAWKGAVVPRWLAVIGFVGGLAGLLTLAVYQSVVLAVLQIGAFAVWGLATGVLALRRKALPT